MSGKADKLNQILELLGNQPAGAGSPSDLCAALTSRKNTEHALAYSRAPYSSRLMLVPQCLRATGACAASEEAGEYCCGRCGSCKIASIVDRASALGYMGVRILKGGSAVGRILEELKPGALLGIACAFEGAIGMAESERRRIPVQFVPLTRDGCSDTDVDLDEVLEVMEFRQP